jgi:septal ring factor EnvC (AmiA/AmiB activator)
MNDQHIRRIARRNRFLGLAMIIITVCMVWVCVPLAQTRQDSKTKLETKKKKLEDEIAYNKKLLEETKHNKNASVNQLKLLKNQIEKREDLLDEINLGIDSLNREIRNNDEMLVKQDLNLKLLKGEYASIIYQEWKMRNSYDRLLFVFAARDFNQAFNRMKYFQQYTDYRKKQAGLIVSVEDDIKNKMQLLEEQRKEQEGLLQENESEKDKLAREKAEKDQVLQDLKKKEASIKKTLALKQAEAKKLKQKIESIIAEEIKKSSGKTNKTPNSSTDVKNVLTPEEKLISDNFISNMGKLPWPVASGVISDYFGEHDHPVLAGIKVKNNGIDISTAKGSAARAVFSGSVVSIVTISDQNRVVILRHGDYFTVYSNLQSVSVAKGANVSVKQSLGLVATDAEEGKTVLHFEVWQGKVLQNPTTWLSPR